jgi:hypothetical protein
MSRWPVAGTSGYTLTSSQQSSGDRNTAVPTFPQHTRMYHSLLLFIITIWHTRHNTLLMNWEQKFYLLDITPCSQLKWNRRFGGRCRLHFQGARIREARNQLQSRTHAEHRLAEISDYIKIYTNENRLHKMFHQSKLILNVWEYQANSREETTQVRHR